MLGRLTSESDGWCNDTYAERPTDTAQVGASLMFRILALSAFIAAGLLFGGGVLAEAEASPLCEHRSVSHSAEHGGVRFDSDWHVAHGDLPTCNEDRDSLGESEPNFGSSDDEPDNKSRYCRKHWYC